MPSLISLRAFESAIRHGSMTRAAQELFVTHGAISKHVQSLESEFGMQLARRLSRSIEATPEGARLAATLATAFALIEEGVDQLRPGPLAVSCSASVMMRWLIPRLADFRAQHPDIDIRISADLRPVDLMRDGIAVAIRNDVMSTPAGVIAEPLMNEWTGPVCSPAYASSIGLKGTADLARCRLLATSSRRSAWHDWFEATRRKSVVAASEEIYEHFYMALHAAACGLGVAVAPRFLVEDDLAEGRLVAPFDFVQGTRNVVLWVSRTETREDVRRFCDWLRSRAMP
ncbi:LysR family transcriptional regulator [soil metagenome]